MSAYDLNTFKHVEENEKVGIQVRHFKILMQYIYTFHMSILLKYRKQNWFSEKGFQLRNTFVSVRFAIKSVESVQFDPKKSKRCMIPKPYLTILIR